jgi:ABC-2 type transport system permease protein
MEHSVINKLIQKINRYIKLYLMLVRYSAQVDFMYWGNFVISMLVELFYQGAFFAFFAVIMTKTATISGWGPYDIIILLGIDTITSELLTGVLIVWNTREIPTKIWNGELDRLLLRPIHPLFNLTLGRPYFPSFISAIVGVVLIIIGVSRLGIVLSLWSILGSAIFFILGFVMVYCIIVNFSLLTFFFQDTVTLPKIGERIVYSFTSRPHTIFDGVMKFIFFFALPVVYVSSFSAKTLISGINFGWMFAAFLMTIFSVLLTFFIWKKAIRSYSSASS